MTSDKVKEILRSEPFQPFIVHLADGRSLNVRHPEQMAISPSGRIAYVFVSDDQHDSGRHLDALMITDIEVRSEPPGAMPGRNGSPS